jgi:hypothetical protein
MNLANEKVNQKALYKDKYIGFEKRSTEIVMYNY